MSRPPYCGRPDCDPATRMVENDDDGRPHRCPCLTQATTVAELVAEEARLHARLTEVRRQLADAQAPDWARGPGPVTA